MTIRNHNGARVPGPLHTSFGGPSGRLPGPLGFGSIIFMAPGPVANVAKMTTMPPPTKDDDDRDVHAVAWPLFKSAKKGPEFNEVVQAPNLANCPVASILAAFAFTPVGRTFIRELVSEKTGNVLTDVSGLKLANPPMDNTTKPSKPITVISSSRYFTVKLPGGSIDVSDVLYTNDGAGTSWALKYMRDPSENSMWAAIIEKALAVQLGSYENFDALSINANDFWKKITGVLPAQITIAADTALGTITAAAKAAASVPSIGASKPDSKDVTNSQGVKIVTEFHGFAMMGLEGSKIKLYDPAAAKTILISPADFRHAFLAILSRK